MATDWAVRAEGLSKKFGLTLRQSLIYGMRDSLGRLVGRRAASDVLRPGEFWAVQDVSFELRPGESLGIMGLNGSGKTTLLRLLNGVFAPDAGRVAIRGRVGALIAAGAGFAPMLTGRENIFVNGALLGMSRREVEQKLDAILSFADIGPFVDSPVKHYSSGMFVRLGFAVAAMAEPEILLVDEVLAVGDLNFQKKCYDYLHRLKRNGTSIILVSHAVSAIWATCDRAVLMHQGRVVLDGSVEKVISGYNDQNAASSLRPQQVSPPAQSGSVDKQGLPADHSGPMGGTGDVWVREVACRALDGTNSERNVFEFGEGFAVEAIIDFCSTVREALVRFNIDAIHYRFIACLDSYEQGFPMTEILPGTYRIRVDVNGQNFMPGTYTMGVAVCRKDFGSHLFFWNGAVRFQIRTPETRFLYAEPNAVMNLDGKFSLERVAP
jgi:lipopolysaccharide transport system ATP-binding protein